MQPYVDAPVVEVHEDQGFDQSLAKLQQDVQEQLQQHQSSSAEQPATAGSRTDSLGASMHTADATDVAAAAANEAAVDEATPVAAATDNAAAVVPASSLISKPASSCEDESEWHLVSPSGSVHLRGGSSSSRTSFDYAGCGASPRSGSVADASEAAADMLAGDADDDDDEVLAAASCCSGSDTEATHTPKDDLAANILGNSVLVHGSHFGGEAPAAPAAEMQASDATVEALHAASLLPSEGGIDGPISSAAAAATEATAGPEDGHSTAAKDAAAEVQQQPGVDAEVLTGLGLLGGEVSQLLGAAQGKAGLSLQGLREWLMESLAALVQTGRVSHAACLSTGESLQRSLHIMAKQGGLAAAAVGAAADWRLVLSSAAAVVCLAMWMRSRNEAATLRASLRRRDHELSKLVMRLVSLQELLNQGQALPMSRYMRYEGAATVAAAASYM